LLTLENLHAYYGDSHILQGVDLSVPAGTRVALVGRNGAGKSTLLKSIVNAGPRVHGQVRWRGEALGCAPVFARARLGIALVPEDRRILPHLSVLENIELAARAVPKRAAGVDARAVLAAMPLLAPLVDRPGGALSGGQQQMLTIARGFAQRPALMLLDEPTEGLAPLIVEELAKAVTTACSAADTALLLCEQNLWFARQCTSLVHVIDGGRIVFSGDWAAFDADPQVKLRHLAV
jgi:ABC-type branched-subunit amino acid transport system ATPase component